MNIYRWENNTRVVEITAKTLEQARMKADAHLYHPITSAHALVHDNTPGTIRQCSKAGLVEDCVKTWTKF
jgi:hypothetical protein